VSTDTHNVRTLLEALPYIRQFHGRTIVIKYGGAAMEDPALREEFARDVVLLKYVGLNPIVVHGGGPEITDWMRRLDMPVEFVGGLRKSDADTVDVVKAVLVGKVNKDIVLRLNRHGQPAVGLCGDDGLLFRVSRTTGPNGEDVGFVGKIDRVDVDVLQHIAQDYIPVIASVGADREGRSYNVNADEAALGGVAGGMRPKLQACLDAIHGGVTHAHIVDGRVAHSILLELFTDAGFGTKITPAQ
jgi:acetylglutamate kinase